MLYYLLLSLLHTRSVSGTTLNVLYISDIKQYFDHDKSSSISQLIQSKLRDLQKLDNYFNGTTTSVSNILLLFGVFLINFVLYSKYLLVNVASFLFINKQCKINFVSYFQWSIILISKCYYNFIELSIICFQKH